MVLQPKQINTETNLTGNAVTGEEDVAALLPDLVTGLKNDASTIFVRVPLIDQNTPHSSDLDVIAFSAVDELLPLRWSWPVQKEKHPLVDLIQLPEKLLTQPETLVIQGVIPHRILSSRLIYDENCVAAKQIEILDGLFYQNKYQTLRIEGLLRLGADAVREIGVTGDFPGLALFWLHMAAASLLSALADGARLLCPNIYTRPFDHVAGISDAYDLDMDMEKTLIDLLYLQQDFKAMIPRLRQIHQLVTAAFPEPLWPDKMRQCTRYEYRYFSSTTELEWRIGVAEELALNGNPWAAVFSIRFWAYMLACIPMVYHRAAEGIDVSFVRPQRAVRPDLEKNCPEIIDDLGFIFGEHHGVDEQAVAERVLQIQQLKEKTLTLISRYGLKLDNSAAWQPYRSDS